MCKNVVGGDSFSQNVKVISEIVKGNNKEDYVFSYLDCHDMDPKINSLQCAKDGVIDIDKVVY